MNNSNYKQLLALAILISLSACGPVHRFTSIKKIPREYSLNYCGKEIKAPKTDLNKEPWIIFSDREKGNTYTSAGGKIKLKDIDYLEAFLVIKKKGDYLRLIKYTPDVLKNGKLDYKKAEYYGWIHKSKLLLNQQSITDISSGKKEKTLVLLSDTFFINKPEKFFHNDSIIAYKDLLKESISNNIAPYSIVYKFKQSDDNKQSLLSNKTNIKADEVESEILGWVDNSLLTNIGTGLHVNQTNLPIDTILYLKRNRKNTSLNKFEKFESSLLADKYKTIKYNSVPSYSVKDSLVAFRTQVVLPLFDKKNNYIFNINGGHISYQQFSHIAKSLKRINIAFVFEGKDQTIQQFPQIVNALQDLQPLFEQSDDKFLYRFSCITTFDDSKNSSLNIPSGIEFCNDYSDIINYLSNKANNKEKLRPIPLSRTWNGLRKTVDSFNQYTDETNLIILIGEKGFVNDALDENLKRKLVTNNCRILGFQVYAGEDNSYNNFVLEIEAMIDFYSNTMLKTKGDILVSPEQVKRENLYKEIDDVKNSYRLDFPNNSITQGYILFPQKGESLPMNVLSNSIDTIIQQIKQDNISITDYMSKAFSQTGNNRTRYDSLFIQNFGLDTTLIPTKKILTSFKNENPGWHMPSNIVVLNKTQNDSIDYRLMLSEIEMNELKEFINSLSSKEVDFKYRSKEKKKEKKKICDCPDDDLFAEINTTNNITDSISPEYENTDKVRKNIYQKYISSIKYCKLCKEKNSTLSNLTIAELQRRIIGIPTSNNTLNSILLKDIKNKKIISDKMLDSLVLYYRKKKEELEKAEKFESNGEVYYWIEKKLLP